MRGPMLHVRGSVACHFQPLPPRLLSVPATTREGGVGEFNAMGPIAHHPARLEDIVTGLEAYRLPPCCVRPALTERACGVVRWLPGGPPSCKWLKPCIMGDKTGQGRIF